MQIYSVGGFVRDTLLRQKGLVLPEGDRDWVVVGSTPEEMISKGYIPVGNDFPVFLHPATHEEYALARTERKTAPGYHGFIFHTDPSITLEEDLRRRDLTINAIAMNDKGDFIDPYNGQRDLENKILRHVSPAFSEDPVRILRVARFSARFPDFHIAPETMKLMSRMVSDGEADALVPERIWAELYKAMRSKKPLRFVDVLSECGLWSKLFPEFSVPDQMMRSAMMRAVDNNLPEESRLAIILSTAPSSDVIRKRCLALKVPSKIQQFCECFLTIKDLLLHCQNENSLARAFEISDALRKQERMNSLLDLWEAYFDQSADLFRTALDLWSNIDAGSIAKTTSCPSEIPKAIRSARVRAISQVFQ